MIVGFEMALSQARMERSQKGWRRTPTRIFAKPNQGLYLVQFSGEHEPVFGRSQRVAASCAQIVQEPAGQPKSSIAVWWKKLTARASRCNG